MWKVLKCFESFTKLFWWKHRFFCCSLSLVLISLEDFLFRIFVVIFMMKTEKFDIDSKAKSDGDWRNKSRNHKDCKNLWSLFGIRRISNWIGYATIIHLDVRCAYWSPIATFHEYVYSVSISFRFRNVFGRVDVDRYT